METDVWSVKLTLVVVSVDMCLDLLICSNSEYPVDLSRLEQSAMQTAAISTTQDKRSRREGLRNSLISVTTW